MNTTKFFAAADIAEIKAHIKRGAMTVNDVHLIVKNELNGIYNTVLSSLYARGITNTVTVIDDESIIYKHVIEDILICYNIPFWKFHALIECDYISVCGSGYIFNREAINLSDPEYDRLMYLTYDIGIAA